MLSPLSNFSGNGEEQRRPEKMNIHLLRRVMKFPAQWPVSHHGGPAAPETFNSLFFLKKILRQKLPLFFLFTDPSKNFTKNGELRLDLRKYFRKFLYQTNTTELKI